MISEKSVEINDLVFNVKKIVFGQIKGLIQLLFFCAQPETRSA